MKSSRNWIGSCRQIWLAALARKEGKMKLIKSSAYQIIFSSGGRLRLPWLDPFGSSGGWMVGMGRFGALLARVLFWARSKPKWCAQKGFIEKRRWIQLDRAYARQQSEELEYWTMGTNVKKKKIKPRWILSNASCKKSANVTLAFIWVPK